MHPMSSQLARCTLFSNEILVVFRRWVMTTLNRLAQDYKEDSKVVR
jgi:hypothetical protein